MQILIKSPGYVPKITKLKRTERQRKEDVFSTLGGTPSIILNEYDVLTD
jgi:hypothetical protein